MILPNPLGGRRRALGYFPAVIRDATADDWPAIWPIFAEIVRAADTFSYDPTIGEDAAREMWMVRPPGRTTVAVDHDGTIVGTANMYANRPGPGDQRRQRQLHGRRGAPWSRHRAGAHR
jgi:hypothetical protein